MRWSQGARAGSGAFAEHLAANGAAVVINFVTNETRAQEVAEGIRAKGGKAVAIRADLSKVSEVRRLFDEAESALGKLDIVVANAATAVIKPLVDCSEEDYDQRCGHVSVQSHRHARGGGERGSISRQRRSSLGDGPRHWRRRRRILT